MSSSLAPSSVDPESQQFWPDRLVASLAGWTLVAGLLFRMVATEAHTLLAIVVSLGYGAPKLEHDPRQETNAWAGLSIFIIPLIVYGCRELFRGYRLGHALGVLVGILAPVVAWRDGYFWIWIFLAPLPLYCLPRLLGWGPKPA